MIRTPFIARSALALALALASVAAMPAVAAAKDKKSDEPAKVSNSKEFATAAKPLQDTLQAAQALHDKKASDAEIKAALAQAPAQLAAAEAQIKNPADKLIAGQFALNLGQLSHDNAMTLHGLKAMVESGQIAADKVGQLQFYIGSLSYDAKDYASAQSALAAAVAAGYHDNDVEALLADAYLVDNQTPKGLELLHKAMADNKARGVAIPENWFRRGLGVAYKNKLMDEAVFFSQGLVENYPSSENWAGAIAVARDMGNFQNQETLDLMRLVDRTNAYSSGRDYVDYIQAADPRRLPAEALKAIQLGLASGKLSTSDVFVTDARALGQKTEASDKASNALASLEKAARAPAANFNAVMASADAYLSYGNDAKAAEMFQLALGKAGADADRVNTRIGIADVDLGKYDDAQAAFAKVGGIRKPIAQLWTVYARQKAAAPAAAPASAQPAS